MNLNGGGDGGKDCHVGQDSNGEIKACQKKGNSERGRVPSTRKDEKFRDRFPQRKLKHGGWKTIIRNPGGKKKSKN